MVINNKYLHNINRVSGNQPVPARKIDKKTEGGFERILQDKLQQNLELKVSKHAEMRLKSRNINLSKAQMEKISQAVSKAEQKGVKDSLLLVDDIALVVNIKNRTVITAADRNELKENVFTNIDGAVII